MKDQSNIDELLNEFIDDQLTQRQRTEVQRLVGNDPEVAGKLKQLQKCKKLINDLPIEQPPEDLLDDIKSTLERKFLLNNHASDMDHPMGDRHLMIRRFATLAAMLLLVGALSYVLIQILMPDMQDDRSKVDEWTVGFSPPKEQEISVKEIQSETQSDKYQKMDIITASLTLKTLYPEAIVKFVNRAICENGLDFSQPNNDAKVLSYHIKGSRKKMLAFLVDMQMVWQGVGNADMYIDSDNLTKQIKIASVDISQISDILSETTLENRCKAAKYFVSINAMKQNMPVNNDVYKPARDLLVPKPILTSNESFAKDDGSDKQYIIDLTVTIIGTKAESSM